MTRRRQAVVHTNPDIMGGQPVFAGTRVPVSFLWEYLEAGDSLDRFLDEYPTVKRKQALAVLKMAKDQVLAHARPA